MFRCADALLSNASRHLQYPLNIFIFNICIRNSQLDRTCSEVFRILHSKNSKFCHPCLIRRFCLSFVLACVMLFGDVLSLFWSGLSKQSFQIGLLCLKMFQRYPLLAPNATIKGLTLHNTAHTDRRAKVMVRVVIVLWNV